MTLLLRMVKALGPLAIIAVLLCGLLAVREAWRGWLKPKEKWSGNVISMVDEIKAVSKLKVLRVIDAGLDTFPAITEGERRKEGYVDYQYSGVTDLYVDLSKADIRDLGANHYVVVLAGIEHSPVREISLNRNLNIDPEEKLVLEEYRKFYGNKEIQTKLLDSLPKLQSDSVAKTALSADSVDRAKDQAERMVRYLFMPLVENPDRDVEVRWRPEADIN